MRRGERRKAHFEMVDITKKVDSALAGKPTEPRHFSLVPFHQLIPGTASTYLVKGLIPRNGIVPVWGPPKCGNSFWALYLPRPHRLAFHHRHRRSPPGPP